MKWRPLFARICFFLWVFLAQGSAFAQWVDLTRAGPESYMMRIRELWYLTEKPQVLKAGKGTHEREFESLGYVGAGSTTLILKIERERVLRLPQRQDQFYFGRAFLRNYAILRKTPLQMVTVYPEESDPSGAYVVARNEHVQFTLQQLLQDVKDRAEAFPFVLPDRYPDWEGNPAFPEAKRYFEALIPFARSGAILRKVPDLKADQIGWTEEGWKLLDFGSPITFHGFMELPRISYKVDGVYALDRVLVSPRWMPSHYKNAIREALREERARARSQLRFPAFSLCEELLANPLIDRWERIF